MAILYDARGNEIRGGFPDAITGEVWTDARTISATLGAVNAESVIDCNGLQQVSFDVRTAAGALTYLWEASIDGTNYFSVPAWCNFQLLVAVALAEQYVGTVVIATTHSGSYSINVAGFRKLRLRVSAYTSGNIVVSVRGSSTNVINYNKPIPSTLHVTATAAANAIATATLPLVAGLFHYITHISLVRNATAAVAGTATLIHTSTNLPGSPAWSVGNAMVAGGTQIDCDYAPTTPLKSSVVGTATTVVMAAGGAAVLNRVNVSYYLGQ